MNPNVSKNFFLLSFLPALAYWFLDSYYPPRIAVAGGLILAIIEISAEKIYCARVHSLSWFNFLLIIGLGGLSLLEDTGVWFRLQPFFTGLFMAAYLGYKTWKGNGMFWEMMESMGRAPPIPPWPIRQMEIHTAIFFILYGCFMGIVAIWGSTGNWIFFKTAGLYMVFTVFMIGELIYMRLQIRRLIQRQKHVEALARFKVSP